MPPSPLQPTKPMPRSPRAEPSSGVAFGLSLLNEPAIDGIESSEGYDPARAIRLQRVERHDPGPWRDGVAQAVTGRRAADGRVVMSLHHHVDHGYRFFVETHGTYVLSAARDTLRCAPTDGLEDWEWQRFLIAQVLPLVAVAAGFEVLHASAVALDERVVALVGGSGAGKTSLALHLAASGRARLFADDALALDRSGDAITAHHGAAAANVDAEEHGRLVTRAGGPIGTVIGADAEGLRVVVDCETRPLLLGAVYMIDRATPIEALTFSAASGAQLLGTTFNLSLRDGGRLQRHLDVMAAVARQAGCHRVGVPAAMDAAELADALAAHAGAH